jgi:hypothetical protein
LNRITISICSYHNSRRIKTPKINNPAFTADTPLLGLKYIGKMLGFPQKNYQGALYVFLQNPRRIAAFTPSYGHAPPLSRSSL